MLIKIRYTLGYFASHRLGRKLLLTSVISTILLIFLTILFLYKKHELNAIKNDEKLVSSYFNYGKNIEFYGQNLPEAETLIHNLEGKLKSKRSKSDVVKAMADLATTSSINLESQVFDVQQDDEGKIYLSLNIVGNYANIRKFINGVSILPFWAEIVSAGLERNNNRRSTLRCQLRIAIQ